MSMFQGRQRFHDRSISLRSSTPLQLLCFPFTRVFLQANHCLPDSHFQHR